VNSTSGTSLGISVSDSSISESKVGGITIIDKESSDSVLSGVASFIDSFDKDISGSTVEGSTRSGGRVSVGGQNVRGTC